MNRWPCVYTIDASFVIEGGSIPCVRDHGCPTSSLRSPAGEDVFVVFVEITGDQEEKGVDVGREDVGKDAIWRRRAGANLGFGGIGADGD